MEAAAAKADRSLPVGGGYGGGNQYGTGYYNPQPRLPATPYNSMMDVYGSSQNVMQPMSGYYNQYPAGGSNYQPYQPQPVYEPTPMPDPPPAPNPGTRTKQWARWIFWESHSAEYGFQQLQYK